MSPVYFSGSMSGQDEMNYRVCQRTERQLEEER